MSQVDARSSPYRGTPHFVVISTDDALNDSDKTFVIPSGSVWDLLHIRYEFTATATVGTRTPEIRLQDAEGNNLFVVVGPTLAASQSSTMHMGPGLARDTANGQLEGPARMLLPSLAQIQVIDTAAVDAAADDLTIRMVALEYAS